MGVSAAFGRAAGGLLVLPAVVSGDRLAAFAGRVVDRGGGRDSGAGVVGWRGSCERDAGSGGARRIAPRRAGCADVLDCAAGPGGCGYSSDCGGTGVSGVPDPAADVERFRKTAPDRVFLGGADCVVSGFRAPARRALDRRGGSWTDLRAGIRAEGADRGLHSGACGHECPAGGDGDTGWRVAVLVARDNGVIA